MQVFESRNHGAHELHSQRRMLATSQHWLRLERVMSLITSGDLNGAFIEIENLLFSSLFCFSFV